MLSLAEYLKKFEGIPNTKAPSHWKADIVNQIIDMVGLNPKFAALPKPEQYKKTYVYWLVLIKKSGKTWGDMMTMLKDASTMHPKYPKGGFITNKLKKK